MDETLQTESTARSGSRNVFQVFWQRRSLILLGAFLGLTLGILTYSQRTPMYRSSAQVLVVKRQSGNALPVAGGDPSQIVMEDYVATHMIVIRSPKVVSMAVEKRNLGALRSLQGRDPVGAIVAGLAASRETSKDGPSGGGNNILNLSYSGSDPGDVEQILKAVIDSYRAFLDKTYQNASEETVTAIRQAVDTLTTNLRQENEKARAFRKKNPVLLGENGAPVYQSKILEYQKKETESREQMETTARRIKEVQKAIDEKQPKEYVLALADRRYEKGVSNQALAQKSNAVALEHALLPLTLKEAELKAAFGKDWPELLQVQEQIKATRALYRRLDEYARDGDLGTGDPVQNALGALRVEEQLARGNYERFKEWLEREISEARKQEQFYDEDRNYQQEIGRLNKVLDATMIRLEQINLIRGNGGFDAKTLSEPGPGGKTSPVLWQFLVLGLFLGLAASAAGAYALDIADKSFRTPEEIRRRLGLPIVGHVPFVAVSSEPVQKQDGAGNPIELDPALITLHEPMSPVSEGFRGIRTALYFSTNARRHKVIQVTSPNMGDGKTTVITNLAVAIAQSGRTVLVVDADLRRPRVHRAFGLTGKLGLAEVIAGTAELDEGIQLTVVPNLSVLPCGRRPQNPAELLTSPGFEETIEELREAYDYVLIDTPPLLAVSDPSIVAPRTDGLILTIRLSKNGRPAAERAGDILAGLKANMIGVVVNGVGRHGSMTGYGYEHYKYADEYTTAYSSSGESNEEGSAATATAERGPMESREAHVTGASTPEPRQSALTVAAAPSANGHSTHAHEGT